MAERDKAAHDKKTEKAPGEVRHPGQAAVRLVLFAVVVLMLALLAWALVRLASRPAPAAGPPVPLERTLALQPFKTLSPRPTL